jgi:hypothetical protein
MDKLICFFVISETMASFWRVLKSFCCSGQQITAVNKAAKVIFWKLNHFATVCIRRSVGWVNQTESKASWSKFHGESSDNLFIFIMVATQCFVQQLGWYISLEVWFIYLNVCCCNGCSCCWVNVNKSKKVVSLVAKIVFTSKFLGSRNNEWQQ